MGRTSRWKLRRGAGRSRRSKGGGGGRRSVTASSLIAQQQREALRKRGYDAPPSKKQSCAWPQEVCSSTEAHTRSKKTENKKGDDKHTPRNGKAKGEDVKRKTQTLRRREGLTRNERRKQRLEQSKKAVEIDDSRETLAVEEDEKIRNAKNISPPSQGGAPSGKGMVPNCTSKKSRRAREAREPAAPPAFGEVADAPPDLRFCKAAMEKLKQKSRGGKGETGDAEEGKSSVRQSERLARENFQDGSYAAQVRQAYLALKSRRRELFKHQQQSDAQRQKRGQESASNMREDGREEGGHLKRPAWSYDKSLLRDSRWVFKNRGAI